MLRCCTRTLYLGMASTLGSSKGGACACRRAVWLGAVGFQACGAVTSEHAHDHTQSHLCEGPPRVCLLPEFLMVCLLLGEALLDGGPFLLLI